jgi:hypothetical protein
VPSKRQRCRQEQQRLQATLSDLIGKTMAAVENNNNEEILFTTDAGDQYRLFHRYVCCEEVTVEDVIGDLEDLVGAPILMAEAVSSACHPEGVTKAPTDPDNKSVTWTFYKFATVKGYVTIRWYGASTGAYSETVDFERVKPVGRR